MLDVFCCELELGGDSRRVGEKARHHATRTMVTRSSPRWDNFICQSMMGSFDPVMTKMARCECTLRRRAA